MPERDANQLAADVRWVVASAEVKDSDRQNAIAALDELVGLVGTLQQERDDLQDACRREREARHKMELRRIAESKRAVAAEAALADAKYAEKSWWKRALAAEEQVATTRQALTLCGDLLFGTWDDDEARRQAHRDAERIVRAALDPTDTPERVT